MRPIVFWSRLPGSTLVALVCAAPGLLPAAQCSPETPPQNAMGVVFQRACDQRESGHYEQAIKSFADAARKARELGDYRWEARSQVYLGACQARIFQYAVALETTEAAAAFAAQTGNLDIAAGAETNAATIYGEVGNFALAHQKLERAVTDLAHLNRPRLLAITYINLSYQQIRLGEIQAGLQSSDYSI